MSSNAPSVTALEQTGFQVFLPKVSRHTVAVRSSVGRVFHVKSRHSTVELRRCVVCTEFATSSRRLSTGAFTPPKRRVTQLDFAVGKFVQIRRDCRQLIANYIHTADATHLDDS